MKTMIYAACAAAAFAFAPMSASAVTATLAGNGPTNIIDNLFADELSDAFNGNVAFATHGEISLNSLGALKFTEVGAESSFNNSFTDGVNTMSENGDFGNNEDFLTFSGGESFTSAFFSGAASGLEFSGGAPGGLGLDSFGIFYDSNIGLGGGHTLFFLAYDDQNANPDDNHDDYIVRVEVVPVPAGILLIGTAFVAAGAVRRFGRKADA